MFVGIDFAPAYKTKWKTIRIHVWLPRQGYFVILFWQTLYVYMCMYVCGVIWRHVGVMLVLRWGHVGGKLGSCEGHVASCGSYIGVIWKSWWCHFCNYTLQKLRGSFVSRRFSFHTDAARRGKLKTWFQIILVCSI